MIEVKFKEIVNNIFQDNFPKRIAVAVSGGIDSMALAILVNNIAEQTKAEIVALVVNHKMRDKSGKEALEVAKELKKNKIECHILESYLVQAPSCNIESSLREVRYILLDKFCSEYNIKHLFVGHHMQDDAENFLIRLFRGSGIDGLSAMSYVSSYNDLNIVRPLLDFHKKDLEDYLLKKEVHWVEDESNTQDKYLRNKIRKFLNSLEDKHLINQRISLANRSILASRNIIESSLLERADNILEFNDFGYFFLKKESFCSLNKDLALRYLAWILMDVSGNHYKPRLKYLENLYSWILKDKEHKKRCLYGCEIEKYDNSKLIIYREKSKIKSLNLSSSVMIWDNRFKIKSNHKLPNIRIGSINSQELNELDLKHGMKGILKKIIYTLPVLKKESIIIAIPHLGYYEDKTLLNDIEIVFDKKTKL
jgi:tRNA(Ile)-lysidine synthase